MLGLDGRWRWLDNTLIGFPGNINADGLFFEDGGACGFELDGSGLEGRILGLGLGFILLMCFFLDCLFKLLQDVESLELGVGRHLI